MNKRQLTEMLKWGFTTLSRTNPKVFIDPFGTDVLPNTGPIVEGLVDYVSEVHPEWFTDEAAQHLLDDLTRSHRALTQAGIPGDKDMCLSDRVILLLDRYQHACVKARRQGVALESRP